MEIVRSQAPLRLGLAGGGTDVAPYSDIYGGAILNATISMYAHATIVPKEDGRIVIRLADKGIERVYDSEMEIGNGKELSLPEGIYNRIVRDFTHKPLSFELISYVDAPPGSGLGTSSTVVVTILGAFAEWLKIPLGEYDLARLAYDIERIDLNMAGGKQDQYAATFGGVNFMEFFNGNKVIVNPLRIKNEYLNELAHNLVLYYTGTSRLSSRIIERQRVNVNSRNEKSIEAMHKLKEQAIMMKEALLRGDIDKIGEILDFGWRYKKQMATGITNTLINKIYKAARGNGATGGKISGAGGGGFMIFYCPGNSRSAVINAIGEFGGQIKRYEFTKKGLTTWTM